MKYQRKLIRELAETYQSNDPLRWVYIANKLNADRRMTPREFRIFKRRAFATFKRMGITMNEALKSMVGAVSKAAGSLADMVVAMGKINNQHPNGAITVHRIPQTEMAIGQLKVAPTLAQLPDAPILGHVTDMKIIVDEAMHLDDDTMKRVEKAVEKDKNRG